MIRLLLYPVVTAAMLLLVGCEESPVAVDPVNVSPVKSYGYRADPPVYEQSVRMNHSSAPSSPKVTPGNNITTPLSSQNNTTGAGDERNLPINTESASQKNAATNSVSSTTGGAAEGTQSVQGFPPGHPLYRDNTGQSVESGLSPDKSTSNESDLLSNPTESSSNQQDESAVPGHAAPVDNDWPRAQSNY